MILLQYTGNTVWVKVKVRCRSKSDLRATVGARSQAEPPFSQTCHLSQQGSTGFSRVLQGPWSFLVRPANPKALPSCPLSPQLQTAPEHQGLDPERFKRHSRDRPVQTCPACPYWSCCFHSSSPWAFQRSLAFIAPM